ncbi:PTS sugar transporter subunit IIC [Listeria monocytogenes]|nr:PTS sugar transporter subunit IIC [Listeria monocytogenes]
MELRVKQSPKHPMGGTKMFDKFLSKMEYVGGKISTLTYVGAIRVAFVKLMPIIILGSFATLLNNVLCSPTNGLPALSSNLLFLTDFAPIFTAINYATMNFLSVFVVFLVAQALGKIRGIDDIFAGIIGIICYISLVPTSVTRVFDVATESYSLSGESLGEIVIPNALAVNYTNTRGMFLAMIVGIFATEILTKLLKSGVMNIHMPESVPPNVAGAFEVLFPSITVAGLFGVLGFVFQKLSGLNISDGIYKLLQIPLESIMQHPAGVIVLALLCQVFWLIGIHGAQVIGIVKDPIGLAAIAINLEAHEVGKHLPNVFTYTFWNTYATIGGSGCTLGLLIAIFFLSKRADYRKIGGLSAIPALFNINEPLIFGLPLVLNPILAIPFIFAPVISSIIGYIATSIGFAASAFITVPFTLPPLVNAFVSTGSFKTVIIQLICILVSAAIYAPFVIAANKQAGEVI